MPGKPEFIFLNPQSPEFLDLPWDVSLEAWEGVCDRLVEVPRGISRHVVRFVSYGSRIYALKEMPLSSVKREFENLRSMQELQLPVVNPVGIAYWTENKIKKGVLITRFLDNSIPYRMLIASQEYQRYRQHLLDALAGLLVQLHLAGVFWGDCSLSNALFRRDAGTLQAYLVDIETGELTNTRLSALERYQDLQIMEENIHGDLQDLYSEDALPSELMGASLEEIGKYIRASYLNLWDEIARDLLIGHEERFRIQERIRALNRMGFSVGEVQLRPTPDGERLVLRVNVTARNFHRHQLKTLTGLEAEEKQAQAMINEIQELKAQLSRHDQRSVPLSEAASTWLNELFNPLSSELKSCEDENTTLAELYFQLLEHKWFLSEKAQRDVGHWAALEDFLRKFSPEQMLKGDENPSG